MSEESSKTWLVILAGGKRGLVQAPSIEAARHTASRKFDRQRIQRIKSAVSESVLESEVPANSAGSGEGIAGIGENPPMSKKKRLFNKILKRKPPECC